MSLVSEISAIVGLLVNIMCFYSMFRIAFPMYAKHKSILDKKNNKRWISFTAYGIVCLLSTAILIPHANIIFNLMALGPVTWLALKVKVHQGNMAKVLKVIDKTFYSTIE